MMLTVGVVIAGVKKGIEKWNRVLMPVLILIFVIFAIFSIFLSGWREAAEFIFYPHLDKLKPSGVLEALGHAFFTLSLGMGAMLTYGSYLDKKTNIPKVSIYVSLLDTGVDLLACMVMFPIIFTYGFDPQAGPGLVFQTFPIIFGEIGRSGMLLSFIFYIKLVDKNKLGLYLLMILSYIASLLSREASLILVVLVLLYHYSFRKKIKLIGKQA